MTTFVRDGTTPVVVLKLVADPLAHAGLGVARSLGRLGVDVHAVYVGDWVPAVTSRYIRSGVRLTDGASHDQVVGALHELAAPLDVRPVLVPVDDPACLFLEDEAEQLAPWYQFPPRPPGLARRLADKGQLAELCRENGVGAPATVPLTAAADLDDFVAAHGYPVVVKAADPERLHETGQASVVVTRDWDELAAVTLDGNGAIVGNVLLQEYIPGGPDTIAEPLTHHLRPRSAIRKQTALVARLFELWWRRLSTRQIRLRFIAGAAGEVNCWDAAQFFGPSAQDSGIGTGSRNQADL